MASIFTEESDDILIWEKVATTSSAVRYTSEIEKACILKAHSLSSNPSTALEVGCEGGRWSRLLSDLGWKLICTEVDQPSLNICKSRIPKAKCILVNPDDTMLSCDTESVDLILCIEVPPVIIANWFVDEVSRVLRKEGLIVGVFWNRRSWRGLIHHALAHLRGDDAFYKLSYPAWRTKFCKNGFDLAEEVGMCWFPFGRKSNSPLIPLAARLERLLGLNRLTRFSPLIVFIAKKL
jgi:SAM-dependent methyltransferase